MVCVDVAEDVVTMLRTGDQVSYSNYLFNIEIAISKFILESAIVLLLLIHDLLILGLEPQRSIFG